MKPRLIFVIWLLLLLFGVLASLSLGAVSLTPWQVWQGITGSSGDLTVFAYRLPRLLLAMAVGGMSAVAGALVQGVIRNPLASPDILGISHGAGLAAVLMLACLPQQAFLLLSWAALVGGLLAAALLWGLCQPFRSPLTLALCGVALSGFYASISDFLLLTKTTDLNGALLWLTGSLWGRGWSQWLSLLPWLILLPLVVGLCKPLNVMTLGDHKAQSLGVNVAWVRAWALLVAVCWSSATVAVCGPIAFIGLVAPHFARRLVGGHYQRLIPMAMLVGAVLLLFADLLGRVLIPPLEIPAGIMTALLGAPYFLYLLIRMRRRKC